jgi:hypothetical protein
LSRVELTGLQQKGHPPASVAPAGGRTLGADRKIRPRRIPTLRPGIRRPRRGGVVRGVAGRSLATPSLLYRHCEDVSSPGGAQRRGSECGDKR